MSPDPAPTPGERIADALEDIARSLAKLAYPDQWLIPPPGQSIARSLELLASCVEPEIRPGAIDVRKARLRTS